MCACLMTLKPLIAKLWPQLLDPVTEDAQAEMESTEGSTGNESSPNGSLGRRFKRSLMEV